MKAIRQSQRLLLTRSQQRFYTSAAATQAEGATGMSRGTVAQETKRSNNTSGREEVAGGGSSATKDSSPLTFNKWRSKERDIEEEMVRRAEQSISKQPEYRE